MLKHSSDLDLQQVDEHSVVLTSCWRVEDTDKKFPLCYSLEYLGLTIEILMIWG